MSDKQNCRDCFNCKHVMIEGKHRLKCAAEKWMLKDGTIKTLAYREDFKHECRLTCTSFKSMLG